MATIQTTNENKVKLSGKVLWSEAREVTTKDDTKLTVHAYLIQNVTTGNRDQEIKATFKVEHWQGLESGKLFAKGEDVLVTGTLAIQYTPAIAKSGKNKGQPIMEKAKDGKEYPKVYQNVIIRAASVQDNLPF